MQKSKGRDNKFKKIHLRKSSTWEDPDSEVQESLVEKDGEEGSEDADDDLLGATTAAAPAPADPESFISAAPTPRPAQAEHEEVIPQTPTTEPKEVIRQTPTTTPDRVGDNSPEPPPNHVDGPRRSRRLGK